MQEYPQTMIGLPHVIWLTPKVEEDTRASDFIWREQGIKARAPSERKKVKIFNNKEEK
jgi:hypothetical protein